METEQKPFDEWAIVEIMGHQKYAGKVSEHVIGGASLLRIDVPAVNQQKPFTKLFGIGSVYAITPTTEEIAIACATKLRQAPLSIYDLPEAMQEKLRAAAPRIEHRDDDDDDREDDDDGGPFQEDDDDDDREEDDDGGPF